MARRRGGSAALGLVVVLVLGVLVAVGLVAGDRYAAGRVEREASSHLQSELGLPTAPSVDVEGWPFLTQVVGRHVRRIRVVAEDIPKSDRNAIPVAHADVVLTDVTSDDWFQTMTARHAEGTARVDYPALAAVAGVPLSYAGDGRVQIQSSTSVFGLDLAATVNGTPRLDVDAQTIGLADPDVRVAGVTLPDSTAKAVVAAVARPIPVEAPLFDLTLTSLTPRDDGLHVDLRGEDVLITR